MEKHIGHYEIVSELGRGGMGVVYKAHEASLNRFVAIKVLGEHLEEDPSYVQRFLREAQSAAKLNHPNIVQIYAINEDQGRHYFVMEYVSGTSLQRILRSHGKMEAAKAARLVLQTGAGLQAAHEQGVIHRDIKPANLLIDDRGLVKIADFGLALIAGGSSRLTGTGMFMGTPGYLSPEQCLDRDVDHRTDIYSLGVTFYEMLTGVMPFKADSPLALLRQIVEIEPPDVRELNPEVDEEIRTVLQKMMAKDREQRFATCGEMLAALQAYLDTHGGASQGMPIGTVPSVAVSPTDAIRLNTSPTLTVDAFIPGDRTEAITPPALPTPPPPPATPPPVATPTQPAVERPTSTPPPAKTVPGLGPRDLQPRAHSNRGPLLAVAIILIGLVGIAGAAGVAWKLGWLERARTMLGGSDTQVADSSQLGETTTEDSSGAEGLEPNRGGLEAGSAEAQPQPEGPTTVEEVELSGASPDGAGPELAPTPPPRSPEPTKRQESTSRPQGPAREHASSADSNDLATSSERHTSPPPTGVITLVVGEPLLAGEVDMFIDRALKAAAIPSVDEHAIPGVAELLASGSVEAGSVRQSLKQHARFLIAARAELLGERPLTFMGRHETAFQANLHIRVFDLASGGQIGQTMALPLEYNKLTVERVVAQNLRPRFRLLVGRLREGL